MHGPVGDKIGCFALWREVPTVVIICIMPISRRNNDGVVTSMAIQVLGNSLGNGFAALNTKGATFAKVILDIDN
jgi:hypothetical protein